MTDAPQPKYKKCEQCGGKSIASQQIKITEKLKEEEKDKTPKVWIADIYCCQECYKIDDHELTSVLKILQQ